MPEPSPAVCVADIVVPPAPDTAGSRRRANKRALLALSETLAHQPHLAVQRLVDCAMQLTQAESAGVSLEDGDELFRWIATAGEFAKYAHGTMPRRFSPCGEAVDRGTALVMREPARYYEYVAQFGPPIRAALLVPFPRKGRLVGTVWVVSHTREQPFTESDTRVVQELTTFATAILDATHA